MLYFCLMCQVCQKCGREYVPKRRGGKFCSTSCRVVRYQLAKKGKRFTTLHSGDEVYLAHKLAAIGLSSREVLVKVKGLPAEQAIVELQQLVQGWAVVDNNVVIERILADVAQERKTDYEAYHKRTSLY